MLQYALCEHAECLLLDSLLHANVDIRGIHFHSNKTTQCPTHAGCVVQTVVPLRELVDLIFRRLLKWVPQYAVDLCYTATSSRVFLPVMVHQSLGVIKPLDYFSVRGTRRSIIILKEFFVDGFTDLAV